jgi:hypothetical protein
MGKDAISSNIGVIFETLATHSKPIGGSKIHCFGKIQALIVAGMVSSRECNDKFTSILMDRVDLNTTIDKETGIQCSCHMMEKIVLILEEFWH